MALGRYWPVDEGDPMELMAGLARCGLLQAPGDQAGGAGDRDPVQRPARQAGTPSQTGAGRGRWPRPSGA